MPNDPYDDPRLYDLEYRDQKDDIEYYVRLAKANGGPILELGCGNGRITVPMAKAGVRVDGVDTSGPMLDALRDRLRGTRRSARKLVRAYQMDFRNLKLDQTYPLVILPFNALHHCPTHRDVLALFAGVRRAMAPGGLFVLDCYLPDPILYQRNPEDTYEHCTFIDPRKGGRLESWERSWYDALNQIHHVIYAYQRKGEPVEEVKLDLRVFYPQELVALLDLSGLRVLQAWSDFQGGRLTAASLKAVLHLGLRDDADLTPPTLG